jgi:hypothetical protein
LLLQSPGGSCPLSFSAQKIEPRSQRRPRRNRAGMDAGVSNSLGLRSKPTAQKRHGCRFWAAQGIGAEIPEAPRPYPHAKRVDEPMRHGVAPANVPIRRKSGAALAAPARVWGAEELKRIARSPP